MKKRKISSQKKKEPTKKVFGLEINKMLKTLMFLLFIYLPFLDILRGTPIKDIEILGIALIELVNFLVIGASIILTFLKIDKRKFIKLIVYILLVGIYIILHYYHIIDFDTKIFSRASFNFIVESYYIVRVYVLPILALFILVENKDIFDYKFYSKVLKIVIAFISFSIIILNITKLSYSSYTATHDPIQYSILDHFFAENVNYKLQLSRGWFDSANEISAILFGLLPLNILMLLKEDKKINVVLYIAQVVAMIILGTRTSAIGALLVSYAVIPIYIVLLLMKQENFNKNIILKFIMPLILATGFFYISPFYYAKTHDNQAQAELQLQGTATPEAIKMEEEATTEEEKKEVITQNLYSYRINEAFTDLYPVENDVEFWSKLCKRELHLNNDSRQMKIDILTRIKERNNNKVDNLLGMGYTLNFMDVERDYVYQFLLFGIIGVVLFLGMYFVMILKNVFEALKNLKKGCKINIALAFMAPCVMFAIAYFSGHVFGWVSPMMYMSFVLGFLNNKVDKVINES